MHGNHRPADDRLSDAEPHFFALLGAIKTIDLVLEHLEFPADADPALCNAFFNAWETAKSNVAALRKVLAYEVTDTEPIERRELP